MRRPQLESGRRRPSLVQFAAALYVPSAVIPQEANVLVNPAHPDMRKVVVHKPERFAFDRRLRPLR